MKRLPSILTLCLATVFLLVACRGEESMEAEPTPTATVPTATASSTPVTSRGEESDEEAGTPTAADEAAETTEGQGVVYSVPFQVKPDGFGFRNYGPGYPEGDFTVADLREIFGDGVCSRIDGDECIPSAEAQQWIADRNADMQAGHCIGFTVTSYQFTQGKLQPDTFTASAADPYDIDREVPIMRTIALNGSLYWVQSVWANEVSGSPRQIIDALVALGEPVDLSIFLPGLVGGHSLLAYGVEQVGPQTYHILVYDNNFPGEEAYVEVDYEANTWRYDQGAVNPTAATLPYEGDAATETLRFIPLSAYETATCPFCPAEEEDEESGEPITLISILGQGEVLIETALGDIGFAAGEIINEIPGARLIFQRGQLSADDAPDIVLPAGVDFTMAFNGLERVSSLSPNLSVVIDRLTAAPENSRLVVTAETQGVDFRAGGEQSPLLNVTLRQDDASYSIALIGVDFADGQGLSAGAAKDGAGLELRSHEIKVADATLLITRQTAEGEAIFASTGLDIQDDGGVVLDIAQWDGGGIDLYADENGDGTYDDQPTALANEPLAEVLQQIDAAAGVAVIDQLGPLLGDQALESILAGLPVEELSGQAIGRILQALQLTDDQLLAYLSTLSLPAAEWADLLFALRLDTERLETLIEGLALATEDEAALRDQLANLALYRDVVADWVFLDTDDLAQLIALLDDRELTADQLAQLLPRLGLSAADMERVLGALQLSQTDLADVVEQLDLNMPATPTPTPTPTTTPAGTAVTATPTISGTPALTPSVTPTMTVTRAIPGTPVTTPDPDAYPGPLPLPTGTPDSYPYPGPGPTATDDPDAYPGGPTATPEFQSVAYCVGDDLRVIAREPTWTEDTMIEVWAGEELLFSGLIGPDDESFEETAFGPGTWTQLYIEASEEPVKVPLGTITCPVDPDSD